jgi:transcriptional regulator NrdR family protein
MKCSICGESTRVVHTRVLENYDYQRKRKCPKGHDIWTVEVQIDPPPRAVAMSKAWEWRRAVDSNTQGLHTLPWGSKPENET